MQVFELYGLNMKSKYFDSLESAQVAADLMIAGSYSMGEWRRGSNNTLIRTVSSGDNEEERWDVQTIVTHNLNS